MSSRSPSRLPYEGIRVIEFTHMVMGPTCGMLLADLGAEVIKVEPMGGDSTRRLLGSGAGFFPMFNRNKKSIALDLKQPEGIEAALRLIDSADVVSENFKAGVMEKLGLGYAALKARNPRLIYVSHKGFLPGPYENRTALDEVVQMMGGLAYMTGRPGDPLRAGASVNDIMGGMFGAMGAMAALAQREHTGEGMQVQASLFENNVFLVGQHMMQHAMTGNAPAPMPSRISAWAVYDVFTVKDGEQVFLAVVSDKQWDIFCRAFGLEEWLADPRLKTNNDRVQARDWLMPQLRSHLAGYRASDLAARFEQEGLPFAPITRPEQLFEDPHLKATGGLAPVTLPDGRETRVPLAPLTLDGVQPPIRLQPPAVGEHTDELLRAAGYRDDEIGGLEGKAHYTRRQTLMIALSRRSFLGAALCAAALPLRAQTAGGYPDGRPIRLIVPYTPGGGTDSVARAIAAKITGLAGWSVVVENRPGAGGNIGLDYVAKTKPDGFMLGLGQTSNLAINPALMPKMPFDAGKDFAAVALIASLPVVLVVKANARWNTLADLVRDARAAPGSIKQALAGSGTVGHLAGELLAYQAKFEVLNVPYRGAAPALNDLLGENTDYMFATPQAAQEMLKGKVLRPLAVTARARLPILPDVPTVAESGFDGFEALDWKALVAPAGTPREVIQAVNGVVEKVLADPATVALFTAEGSTAMGGTPDAAQQYILQEQKKWARLIREANIQTAS